MDYRVDDPGHEGEADSRECEKCGQEKPDVRLDPRYGRRLCNACWVRTPPHRPEPRRWTA